MLSMKQNFYFFFFLFLGGEGGGGTFKIFYKLCSSQGK